MHTKTCIIVAGPTAVGKTSLAIALAQHFQTQIISADSRQCYTELGIGVAKPGLQQLNLVKHYFINSHSIHDEVNAMVFEQYALQAVDAIFKEQPIAVLVGGTGLYIKAFCEGMDAMPLIPTALRNTIIAGYENNGLSWLQQQVQEKDPAYFATGEIQNPQRLMRALEIKLVTGQSILAFQTRQKKHRPFNIIKIGLQLTKEDLHRNINNRVDEMMEQGLAQEVKSLLPYRHLNALQTVGYKELFDFYAGGTTLPIAVDAIKKNTRHYAKRQLTWFKKDDTFKWFNPEELPAIIEFVKPLK